jgi:hypothetical protein
MSREEVPFALTSWYCTSIFVSDCSPPSLEGIEERSKTPRRRTGRALAINRQQQRRDDIICGQATMFLMTTTSTYEQAGFTRE